MRSYEEYSLQKYKSIVPNIDQEYIAYLNNYEYNRIILIANIFNMHISIIEDETILAEKMRNKLMHQ